MAAALLSLPLLASAHAPALADTDERPDLKIELVNAPIGTGQRDVQLRVTNVSAWWADETTVHVETISPNAGNARDIRLENLDPGQSTSFSYLLDAGCEGHVIRADVAAAGNYEGVKESKLDNNRLQGAVCQAKTPEAPVTVPGVKTTPPPDVSAAPAIGGANNTFVSSNAHGRQILAPRAVTVTVKPSARQVAQSSNFDPEDNSGPGANLQVGWSQSPGQLLFSEDHWTVTQSAVNFDLGFLQQTPGTQVREAVLRYTELQGRWQDGAGRELSAGNCVQVLGRATEDWRVNLDAAYPEQFANDKVQAHSPGVQAWYVTSEIRDQWIAGMYPPFGFVLRGGNDSPQGHDNRSCHSVLDNVTLELTYEVPQ
jgi:hypothetical protein